MTPLGERRLSPERVAAVSLSGLAEWTPATASESGTRVTGSSSSGTRQALATLTTATSSAHSFVELHAEGLTARTSIYLGPEGVEEGLDDFFGRLATDWRGWAGTRSWKGMEGGLDLHCVNDRVATVKVAVVLRHLSVADWTVKATVPVDLGQLDAVAADFHRLLTLG